MHDERKSSPVFALAPGRPIHHKKNQRCLGIPNAGTKVPVLPAVMLLVSAVADSPRGVPVKIVRAFLAALIAASLAVPALAAQPETATPGLSPSLQYAVTPVRGGTVAGIPGFAKPGSGGSTNNGISYRGGPVMNAGVNVYLIWYGKWDVPAQRSIITNFVSKVGGSPYYRINTTYYDGNKVAVKENVTLAKQYDDAYSQGATNLSDGAIQTIVSNALPTLGADSNGIYFVLTSADVSKSGFLTSYCGWHTYATMSNTSIKYSFVGNPGTNTACLAQTTSPNGDPGVDGMISVIAHELEEAVTDPQLNAWYDSRGYENADKCAWTFGTTSTASNGSKYNMTLGTMQYLIQRNWVNASGGYCALNY